MNEISLFNNILVIWWSIVLLVKETRVSRKSKPAFRKSLKNLIIYCAYRVYENSSKGDNYKLFKHDLKFEDYLDVLDDKKKFLLV